MKKTRIIIPALAMIAFSVAASITGTVAWFTANRTAQIDAGTYAVVKTTSDLKCDVASGIGTTATNNTGKDVIAVNGKLSDASFDHIGNDHYIYEPSNGQTLGKKVALASATDDNVAATTMVRGTIPGSTPTTVYTAITWEVTFTLDFGAVESTNIGLYLDLSKSKFEAQGAAPAGSNDHDTSKGFRMAFIPNSTNGVARVFADLQTSANCTHILESGNPAPTVGQTLPSGTAYGSSYLMHSGSANPANYASTDPTNEPSCLGYFAYASNAAVELSYTVVCWFEGTDENIVNSSTGSITTFRDVKVSLEFTAANFPA